MNPERWCMEKVIKAAELLSGYQISLYVGSVIN